MLPSGLVKDSDYLVREIEPGLYVVEGAYEGEYDFFAPSRLYGTLKEDPAETESTGSEVARD